MANKTITVLEADGTTQTDVVSLDVGRQAAAASKSLALSTEDKAVLDLLATEAGLTTLGTRLTAIETAVDDLTTLVGSGDVAHGDADTGIPAKIGFKAVAGLSSVTLVDANDRTDGYAGLDGAQFVRPHCGLSDIVSGNANNTDGSSTSVITAAGAGIKQYLTSVVLTNTSSSNIYVEMKSGTTVKATIPLPANSGAIFNPPVPLPPNAANEAWNFDPSAATTTVYCTAVGFKSKV